MARVQLEGLRKVYDGGTVAVHGANLDVADGEFIVLVGPSGCGKSTLLRMIAGLESITEGRLFIGGRLVNDRSPQERDIAMVFQHYALYPHMSVFDNMAFGLKMRKVPKAEIGARVREVAQTLSIEHVLDRRPKQLSGGQRQRVALGRAIVRQPQVFLFDEPLSNLDAKLRAEMRAELARLHMRLGATMIYVTHDQTEAMTMAGRIVVLKDGRVQQSDAPLALYNRPANRFVAGFMGSPAMNLVDGRLAQKEGGLRFEARGWSMPVGAEHAQALEGRAGAAVTLGIRPEDIAYAVGAHTADGSAAEVPLRLEVVEPMGREVIVYVRAGSAENGDAGETIVARLAPQALPEPGQALSLRFDLSKIHFFDAETGAALTADAVETAH